MIYNCDALSFPVGAYQFDHVIIDPPYSRHVHKSASTMRGGKAGHNEFGFAHLSPELRRHIARHVAHARRWSVIFSDWESLNVWRHTLRACGATYTRVVPWVRWSMPQLSGDRPPQGSEAVIIAWGSAPASQKSWNGPGNLIEFDSVSLDFEALQKEIALNGHAQLGAFFQKCLRGDGKHPTEKPLDLMLQIVEWFTEPGAWVLDLCSGSGTTPLAARLLGRNGVGVEMDPHWAASSYRRAYLEALSDRDAERWGRYWTSKAKIDAALERMRSHTAGVRGRLPA